MAAINIYVGNLSFDTGEDQLKELFEGFGQVESATIISDKFTGRPRGFGFVKMPEREEGLRAIQELEATLGIRGSGRAHYWKLFFWTLFRRPRLFPLAITLAIYGYHFRQVAALHVG